MFAFGSVSLSQFDLVIYFDFQPYCKLTIFARATIFEAATLSAEAIVFAFFSDPKMF